MMKERLWSTMLGDGFTILLILHLFTQVCGEYTMFCLVVDVLPIVGTLTCLSCDSVPSPTDCMYVQTCGPHSVCFLEMLVSSAGEIRYRLGCRDTASYFNEEYCTAMKIIPDTSPCESTSQARSRFFPKKCTPDTNKRNNNITVDIIPHVTEIAGADTYRSQTGFRHRRTEKLVCNRCCNSSNLCNAQGCGRNGYSLARGPICFACDQQRQPLGCHEIQVCGRDELCYIEEFSLAGYTLYHTSCMSYSKCSYDKIIMTSSMATHPVSFVGRSVRSRMNYPSDNSNLASLDNKRSLATSRACCDQDMCNTKLPGNGNWGPWTTWGGCTVSCGYTGTRTRTRRCNYPPPDMGGQPCPGEAIEVDKTCSNRPCDTGMVCLSCDSSISPRTCNFVEVCGPHSVCYLERYITSVGDVSFRSGCRDKKQCVNGITKRFMVSGDHLTCSECCNGDLCNSHGCGGLPYPAIRGPVCFNCDQQHDPQMCNKIDVCSDGQKMGNVSSHSDSASAENIESKRVCESQEAYVSSLVENPKLADETDGYDSDSGETTDKKDKTDGEDEVDSSIGNINIFDYDFPFENLVFEGGGNKGLGYVGAVRVLEQTGIMKNIRRFAGASAGAITAGLLAVGFTSDELKEALSQDLSKIFIDHSWGYLSLLPNLIYGYGWNPGQRIFDWFGEAFRKKTGKPDITFKEVYQIYHKELCVTVTNINLMSTEYLHVKTSPDMPVRVALCMSMAIPGLFKAKWYRLNGLENIYVDGGVLCNYPINCFDGWWLSMKVEDSFLNKLQPLHMLSKFYGKKLRFGTYNPKTIGFLLYADHEKDLLQDDLERRVGSRIPDFPDTELGRERKREKDLQENLKVRHQGILRAVDAFFKVLRKHNKDNDDKIDLEELRNALSDTEVFPKRYAERLFGKNVTVEEAMAALDKDQSGTVDYNEIVQCIEKTGVCLQTRFLGYQRTDVKGVFDFFSTLTSTVLTNVQRTSVERQDIERTVGINTGHVRTNDFALKDADKEYAFVQGKRSTEAFLRYYTAKHKPPKKA